MNQFRFRTNVACRWPHFPPNESLLLGAAYRQLVETQWLASGEIEQGQMAQLRLVWQHCLKNCPYYQSVDCQPDDLQTLQDLAKLPILTRESLSINADQIRANQLPQGVVKTGTAESAGTTGVPVQVEQTNFVNLWWFAYYLRDLDWCDVDPRGRLASIRAFGMQSEQNQQTMAGRQLPYWSKTLNALIETGPSFAMDIQQDPRRQLQWLRQVQPNYLLTYSSNLQLLGGLIQESGEPIASIKAVLLISEAVPSEFREEMEAIFEAPLKDTYSCAEAGYLASPCPSGRGAHVHAENTVFEVLDDQGRRCGPGETGRVVLTTLQNMQMPLIRYAINDRVTIADQPCNCGRQLLHLKRIEGKERPLFVLQDGRRKTSSGLVVAISACGVAYQHQIVQTDPDQVTVRIVPNQAWTDRANAEIRQIVQNYFESPVHVSVETANRIAPAPGGKLLNVIVQC